MNDLERVGRNLVRSFYDPLPTNDSDDPIWLLGERYDPNPPLKSPSADPPTAEDESWIRTSLDDTHRHEAANGQDPAQYGGWPSAFLDDFESRIWMTYRSAFPAIAKSQHPKAAANMSFRVRIQNLAQPAFTSDTGFGCMIRSAQCILANALQVLSLGRDWRWQRRAADAAHCALLALFADDPRAPFSIHRFVEHGAAVCGKHPGEWFGPSAAARCIQDLANKHKHAGLQVYLSTDGADVYEDKLKHIALDHDGNWQPTLILVGTRLGIDKITPVYWEALKAALHMKQSIGIAGGRPSASHYFVGTQANTFFYLDPHSTRPLFPYHPTASEAPHAHASPSDSMLAASHSTMTDSQTTIVPSPTDAYTPADLATCHTRRIRRLHIAEMDPSMLLAFLVTSQEDYDEWKAGVQSVQGKALVHVQEREPAPRGHERDGAIDEVESWDDETE